jgi:hypothetical protein
MITSPLNGFLATMPTQADKAEANSLLGIWPVSNTPEPYGKLHPSVKKNGALNCTRPALAYHKSASPRPIDLNRTPRMGNNNQWRAGQSVLHSMQS